VTNCVGFRDAANNHMLVDANPQDRDLSASLRTETSMTMPKKLATSIFSITAQWNSFPQETSTWLHEALFPWDQDTPEGVSFVPH